MLLYRPLSSQCWKNLGARTGETPNLPSCAPAATRAREDDLGVAAISSHCRHGLADGEQRVALCSIRTEPESTVRYVPHSPERPVSTTEGT